MRGLLVLVLAVAMIALAAAVDPLFSLSRMPSTPHMSVTSRLWLAALATTLFAALNCAIAWVAFMREGVPKWAFAIIALIGGAGVLYLPLRAADLPVLSQLLSARVNPLTAIVERGGFISLLRFQTGYMLVAGLIGVMKQSERGSHKRGSVSSRADG
jgi:hypothetical protein